MATHTRSTDLGRPPYRLTARQVERMIAAGIIADGEDVELVGGVLYKMVKQEPHNFAVGQVAELLRKLIPADFHVREEKSVRHGRRSLPEPDVVIAPGRPGVFRPTPPRTDEVPLIVEVCHHSRKADYCDKLRRYAAAGVSVYWVVDLDRRSISVFGRPAPSGDYAERTDFPEGKSVPVILDGVELGRVVVSEVLPPNV